MEKHFSPYNFNLTIVLCAEGGWPAGVPGPEPPVDLRHLDRPHLGLVRRLLVHQDQVRRSISQKKKKKNDFMNKFKFQTDLRADLQEAGEARGQGQGCTETGKFLEINILPNMNFLFFV